MQRTRIEWTDYTWNPIKGICPIGCWYCYARKMYKRFKWDETIRLDSDELVCPMVLLKPSKIFVCSTFEIFSPVISHLKDLIFKVIEKCPQHTFQILTKFPQNIDRPMPDNVWLGTSVTGDNYERDWQRFLALKKIKARIKFVSYEPILGNAISFYPLIYVDWMIVGRLTGYGHKYDPPKKTIQFLVDHSRIAERPIFLKDNLKEIWGEPLIQEMPK